MKVYAVYERLTGRLVSIGTVLANPLPSTLATSEYNTPTGTIPADWSWDPASLAFVVPPPPEPDPEVVATATLLDKTNRTRAEDSDLIQRLTALVPPDVWTG